MKGIAGVVIVYYPTEEVWNNVQSYLHYTDRLYIVDNTPAGDSACNKGQSLPQSVQYIKNDMNLGIAAALNIAVDRAAKEGYKWLLTMDQDSWFEKNEVEKYFRLFEQDFYNRTDAAIVSLQHANNNETTKDDSYGEAISTITSGSFTNISICKKVGGFDEQLFIDEVDHEYCYRCILNGYKIYIYHHIYLTHQLGKKKRTGYLSVFKKSDRIVHNPDRIYYMVRNHFLVTDKYKRQFPLEMKAKRKQLLVTLKNNLFFSGQFFKVLSAAVKGYIHFKQNRFS